MGLTPFSPAQDPCALLIRTLVPPRSLSVGRGSSSDANASLDASTMSMRGCFILPPETLQWQDGFQFRECTPRETFSGSVAAPDTSDHDTSASCAAFMNWLIVEAFLDRPTWRTVHARQRFEALA